MKPALAIAILLAAGSAFAGDIIGGRLVNQIGVRLSSRAAAKPKVGDTFQGVVVDPAKLSGFGFNNLKQGDRVTLKITGPNNEFELQRASSPTFSKAFHFDPQGKLVPGPVSAAPSAH
ncbi:MAG: hypothetical protein NEA02_14785 [Thermoanaerobaculia bacterium]|nr:hypothetical protein [Thermoanaerobaculia bacterium]